MHLCKFGQNQYTISEDIARKLYFTIILSQSSNATLFYFDNIFVRTNTLGRLVRLNKSSFGQTALQQLVV